MAGRIPRLLRSLASVLETLRWAWRRRGGGDGL